MLVGKATELFVDSLARASQKMALANRRKTIKCVGVTIDLIIGWDWGGGRRKGGVLQVDYTVLSYCDHETALLSESTNLYLITTYISNTFVHAQVRGHRGRARIEQEHGVPGWGHPALLAESIGGYLAGCRYGERV